MTSRFLSYAQDIELLKRDIDGKFNELGQDSNSKIQSEISNLIEESLDILDSMNLEVQSLPTAERSNMNAQLRTLRSDFSNYQGRLNDYISSNQKRELFGDDDNYQQRQALLSTNASIERSTQRLQDATRTALESENVGSSILSNLRTQRDQILNARDTLGDADTYVDRSLRTLGSMSRRMVQNKFLTYGIIALLILLILLTLYSKFS